MGILLKNGNFCCRIGVNGMGLCYLRFFCAGGICFTIGDRASCTHGGRVGCTLRSGVSCTLGGVAVGCTGITVKGKGSTRLSSL